LDHKWGRNITDLGLGDLGGTMCSPFLGLPQAGVINFKPTPTSHLEFFIGPAGAPLRIDLATVLDVGGVHHFPYGRPVVPDAPM